MNLPKSCELVFHARDDVFDVFSDLQESWKNRLTFDDPRLAERYLKGELRVIVDFSIGNVSKKDVALLEREQRILRFDVHLDPPGTETATPGGKDMNSAAAVGDNARSVYSAQRHSHGNQEPMLVDIVKLVESPERDILSLVWLETVDNSDSIIPHSLYFSLT